MKPSVRLAWLACDASGASALDESTYIRLCTTGTQVVNTEPTGALSALLTTSDGISLVFDPLIRKPTQVAADIVDNIAQGVSGGRR